MQCVVMFLITDLGNSGGGPEGLEKVLLSFECPWCIQVPVTSPQMDRLKLSFELKDLGVICLSSYFSAIWSNCE